MHCLLLPTADKMKIKLINKMSNKTVVNNILINKTLLNCKNKNGCYGGRPDKLAY